MTIGKKVLLDAVLRSTAGRDGVHELFINYIHVGYMNIIYE